MSKHSPSKNYSLSSFNEFHKDVQEELTEASFRNLSAAAALTIALSQRKKVISKVREAKKPNTPIEDKLDLLGDALVHLSGAMTAVSAGAYKRKNQTKSKEVKL